MDEGKSHILLVDDDPDIRNCVKTILTVHGLTVTTAADGNEALVLLRSSSHPRPSLILLDLMMPGMNGFEFCSRVSTDQELVAIPVVLVTGAGILVDQQNEFLKTREVLRKPLDLEILLQTVDRFCSNAGS